MVPRGLQGQYPLRPIEGTYSTKLFNSIADYNSPAARTREVFKPPTDLASLLVSTEKKNFSFGFGVLLGGDVTSGGIFAFFAYFTRP